MISDWLLQHEPAVRLAVFGLVFLGMALWELFSPRRSLRLPRAGRWTANLGILAIDVVTLRLVFPFAAVGLAAWAEARGLGLFALLDWPAWLEVLLALVLLDFAIWLQHVVFHAVPVLWRLHRVHHADLDYDLTTGSRFHPLEILLSMLIKAGLIIMLGPAALAVLLFEVILNGAAMFNHGNVSLPRALDRVARWFIVTPDMHRVHHSREVSETNSNFGFNLACWDRIAGTYVAQPAAGHAAMQIGLQGVDDVREADRLPGMLLMPFRGKLGDYAVNRRRFE